MREQKAGGNCYFTELFDPMELVLNSKVQMFKSEVVLKRCVQVFT